jgi:uncharacterized damage-inducible protein DinB
MLDELLDTWRIHDRINRYLLDAIPAEALDDVSASKGRTVAEQFAHIHNVRLMWLKAASPVLLRGLQKIEKDGTPDHEALRDALAASATAIESLLRQSLESAVSYRLLLVRQRSAVRGRRSAISIRMLTAER